MKNCTAALPVLALLLLLSVTGIATADGRPQGHLTAPSSAIFVVDPVQDWSFGASALWGDRELDGDRPADELNTVRWQLDIAHTVADWLQLRVNLGGARADFLGEAGDYGPAWSIGARAGILEYIIDESPVLGPMQTLRLSVDLQRDVGESDFDGEPLEWTDVTTTLLASYTLRTFEVVRQFPYRPTGTALHAGLCNSFVDVDYADESYSETSETGWTAGLDVLFGSGVVLGFDTRVFSAEEVSGRASLGYNF
jgi:hypothetical protein